jgi:hypothetical protein
MQFNDVVEIIAISVFSGDTVMAGLFMTAVTMITLFGIMSLAKPPTMAYILMSFMGILMGMALGWLDMYLGAVIILVAMGGLAYKIGDTYAD